MEETSGQGDRDASDGTVNPPSEPETGPWRRGRGVLASLLGWLGALLSLLLGVGLACTAWKAADVVDTALTPITNSLQRLDNGLITTTTKIQEATTMGELQTQLSRASAMANTTEETLTGIINSPVVAKLPINTEPVTTALGQLADTAQAAEARVSADPPQVPASGPAKTAAVEQLTNARERLAQAQSQINTLSGALHTWIRVSALGGILLCWWGLWGQFALARSGRRMR